jgi:hypothetical protein
MIIHVICRSTKAKVPWFHDNVLGKSYLVEHCLSLSPKLTNVLFFKTDIYQDEYITLGGSGLNKTKEIENIKQQYNRIVSVTTTAKSELKTL